MVSLNHCCGMSAWMFHDFSSHVVFIVVEVTAVLSFFEARRSFRLWAHVKFYSSSSGSSSSDNNKKKKKKKKKGKSFGHDMYACTPYGHVVQAALRLEE
jgi:hypothetical protein